MMHDIQIIETPKGEKMAILPLGDYNRLRELAEDEDARDIRAADAIMARPHSALIPATVVEAIAVKGVHPIRAFRDHYGWTAEQLAKKAGLGRTTVTQMETRERKGTLAAYKQIAKLFGVSVDILSEE